MPRPELPLWFVYPWRIEGKQTPFHPWALQSYQRHLATAISEAKRQKAASKFYATRVRVNNDQPPTGEPVTQNLKPQMSAPTLVELMEQGYSAEQAGIHIAFADAMVGRDLALVVPVVLIALENVCLAALPPDLLLATASLMSQAAFNLSQAAAAAGDTDSARAPLTAREVEPVAVEGQPTATEALSLESDAPLCRNSGEPAGNGEACESCQ